MAADISAETWLGASGCARGSQACSGTRPAFDPNPARTRTNTVPFTRRGQVRCGLRERGERVTVRVAAKSISPARTHTKPRWVITAYQRAASATSGRRCARPGPAAAR